MGSYSSLSVHDPKTFTVELIMVLMRFPPSVAEYGIVAARKASPQFIPSIAQIEHACEQHMQEQTQVLTYADQWNVRARQQLEERREQERRDQLEPLEQRRAVVARVQAEMIAAFRNMETTRPQQQTWRRLSDEELRAIYGKPTEAAE